MYERVGTELNQTQGGVKSKRFGDSPLGKSKDAYSEIADIFPALQKYKDEHNTANLKKLLVEVSEFCRAIYASTQNEAERKIYRTTIEKLNK